MTKRVSILASNNETCGQVQQALASLNFIESDIIDYTINTLAVLTERQPDLVVIDDEINNKQSFMEIVNQVRTTIHAPVILLIDKYNEQMISEDYLASKKYHFAIKPIIQRQFQSIVKISLHSFSLEKKLRKTEFWFGNIIKSVGDGIITLDVAKNVTFLNFEAEQLTGWDYDDAIGRSYDEVFRLIHSVSRDEVADLYQAVIKEGVLIGFSGEENLIDKYGTEKPIDYAMIQIHSDDNELLGVMIAFGDAVSRRLSYDYFHQSEAQFRLFVENASDMIFRTDNDLIFTYINPAVSQVLGYTPEELTGKNYSEIIHQDYKEKLAGMLVLKPDMFVNENLVEYKALRKDGHEVWLSQKFQMLRENDVITGFQGIARDVTTRKQTEEDFKKAKEAAEAASKLKSSFLANMSHELRTPLNAVIGYCQLLEMQQIGTLNEKQVEFLNIIKDAGNHLMEMVNDILDLSKIEAGKFAINKAPFDMRLMLSRAPTTIKSLADKKGVKLITDIAEDIGYVDADEIRIKQVIYNLLSNAIKFTDPGKSIGLKARGKDDRIFIQVWDEGIGIEKNKQEKIFNPFEQIDRDYRVKNKGSGLGLSITRRLMELHGGYIEVVSEPGKGSRFTIMLPERYPYSEIHVDGAGPQQTITMKPGRDIPDIKRKILVVDDIDLNRHLLEKTLNLNGYDVLNAESGEEAVELALHNTIDLIMMDIQLKDMNGVEAMQRIRKVKKNIPVFAFTAYAMKGDKERFLNYGFDEYISKPVDLDKMLKSIKKCLSEA